MIFTGILLHWLTVRVIKKKKNVASFLFAFMWFQLPATSSSYAIF